MATRVTFAPASQWPFGAPDAASDPEPPPYSAAASAVAGPAIRVLVGRMGAGKTRYLVELQQSLRSEGECELTAIDSDLPSLVYLTRLAEDLALDPVERGEIWIKLWRRAIVRSALSHLLWRAPGGSEGPPDLPDALVPRNAVPHTIYNDFSRILGDHQTVTQLRVFLDDPGWGTVEFHFRELVRQRATPLCFFLDTIEEDSSHAPRYWLWCQLGLVREVLRVAHDKALSDRLRVFAAIRDQTWAELLTASKPSMYEQHPQVLQLRWRPAAAAQFLAEKIDALSPEYRLLKRPPGAGVDEALKAWLGTDRIRNGSGAGEPLLRYLLRHTRLIPRDIVTLGNLLSAEVLAARARRARCVPRECISNAVAAASRLSAREELQACALEVIARRLVGIDRAADRRRIVPDEDEANRVLEAIKQLLGGCGAQVVQPGTLEELDAAASQRFEADVSLARLLSRRGLLGWSSSESGPYAFSHGPLDPPLGERGRVAAMHPCLLDELGLEAARGVSVVPFPEGELS